MEEFYHWQPYHCKPCEISRSNIGTKKYHDRIRKDARDVLGGRCVWCGITDYRILQIDHIFGGGPQEKAKGNANGLLLSIIRGERHDDLQLLCANCHQLKTLGYTKDEPWLNPQGEHYDYTSQPASGIHDAEHAYFDQFGDERR